MPIENELAQLTNGFSDNSATIRCYTESDKEEAKKVFQKYYDIVEVSDGRKSVNDKMNYIISCGKPKMNEVLNEDDDFDLSEFDDPEDSMDLDEFGLDSIDDTDEVADADQITVLKKRAADLADKWQETFKEISELARKLDLVATHDDDLKIELKKSDGDDAEIEADLDELETIDNDYSSEFDDDYGPSDFDSRADNLEDSDEEVKESLETKAGISYQINESMINNTSFVSTSSELYLSEDAIDDDI